MLAGTIPEPGGRNGNDIMEIAVIVNAVNANGSGLIRINTIVSELTLTIVSDRPYRIINVPKECMRKTGGNIVYIFDRPDIIRAVGMNKYRLGISIISDSKLVIVVTSCIPAGFILCGNKGIGLPA
jgi:hypothetical protein